jgi:uncharacterized protein
MINRLLKIPILIWHRLISPALPPMCRFYPSCAAYALEALDTLPWYRALGLTAWRIVRCNPFCRGGFDPVPAPHDPACGCPDSSHPSQPPRRAAGEPSSETMIIRNP